MTRRSVFVVALIGLLGVPGLARAEGPSGSKEEGNQVTCADGTDTPVGRAYAGANGAELCSDDDGAPDGRIIVSFDGQYASADGDADNGEQASGFVRVDSGGPTCSTAQQSDATEGPGGSCG